MFSGQFTVIAEMTSGTLWPKLNDVTTTGTVKDSKDRELYCMKTVVSVKG